MEAQDNSDMPNTNIAKAKVDTMTLTLPQHEEVQEGGKKQAADGKAENDKKQDQDLNRENEAKKQEGEPGDEGKQDGTPQQGDKPEGDQKGDAKDEAVEKQARDLQDKLDKARQQDGK